MCRVNVDVDVPLYLPLSGQRRLYDLRRTARLERQGAFKISGQMNFESGWEFGYSLSNAITARAVWDPVMGVADDWAAYRSMLSHAFGMLEDPLRTSVVGALVALAQTQAEVMVQGLAPADIVKLNGHAYMSGADTWVDLSRLLGLSLTQPDKVHVSETSDPLWGSVLQLLGEMDSRFAAHRAVFSGIEAAAERGAAAGTLSPSAHRYLREMADGVTLLSLRAAFNYQLYSSQTPSQAQGVGAPDHSRTRLIIQEAGEVMDRRVAGFRVPVDRIAGWRQGPTTYPFGYVWAAKSL